ncbi:Pyridoxamine 5'-phosphate oxidase [Mycobacteroides salmoniphilum]|uniref:Pyridoxamine 5'-phosphate oxidase n=2 Tax=Mycobacteroides salmoniphilum TaxID=404941 RepID=A0A4R8SWL9_9MYCO|nr:Pyridoxamine 5'-phosphate oxidase [Mycobacteroides salmoniphilum]TEA06623.1 Pyridoxamine 5'-phosphate oxidase [Mycobacteroides salmoniphilum]
MGRESLDASWFETVAIAQAIASGDKVSAAHILRTSQCRLPVSEGLLHLLSVLMRAAPAGATSRLLDTARVCAPPPPIPNLIPVQAFQEVAYTMPTLTDEMKRMLGSQLAVLATVTDGTTPNIGPKRSLRVHDERSLIFNENTGGQTLANILAGSKVSVAVIDRDALDGYRFVGSAHIHDSGPAFDNAVAFAEERGMKHPRCAVVIAIEGIYTLKPGVTAGKPV